MAIPLSSNTSMELLIVSISFINCSRLSQISTNLNIICLRVFPLGVKSPSWYRHSLSMMEGIAFTVSSK